MTQGAGDGGVPGGGAAGPAVAVGAPFASALADRGLVLRRGTTTTLQVNTGLLCNQACRHCHLGAGPGRTEVMTRGTMSAVEAYAGRAGFSTIDVTGGAPELVPGIAGFLERLALLAPRTVFRASLTALASRTDLVDLLARLRVAIIASFPALSAGETDAQRGAGVFATSLRTLRALNVAGYGREGSGLELDLVVNPPGAALAPAQAVTESRFRVALTRERGISFNRLFTFANVPLGRFGAWLTASGNHEAYLRLLAGAFNPDTVGGLMCRSLVSVSWDGMLHDCDFNLACGLPLGGTATHVSAQAEPPAPGARIATGEHCYACTAGAGFT